MFVCKHISNTINAFILAGYFLDTSNLLYFILHKSWNFHKLRFPWYGLLHTIICSLGHKVGKLKIYLSALNIYHIIMIIQWKNDLEITLEPS